ncbi:MAG TPA: PIG-L family deacetylase, partial [Actinomycetota bacterium]|nr:PIG-L family deacetylase [Actinomycetota bacterium]
MSSPARSRAASSLTSRLRALGAGATLLHVGAHPDDEQSALIARVSLGDGAHAAYWSATRGEGGQNAVGAERGEALGIIRTWESLAARRFDGGEVLYGPFYDFGYSKRGAETLARWGRDRLVDEIVRAIRVVRPQVVVSRWSGGPGDGHGHHQAIGLVIEEAFDAAGEPARGPSLPSWSPVRLYRSLAGDWQAGEEDAAGGDASADGDVWIDAGEIEPESGRTFEELAREGCNRHRSQGFALLPRPGSARYGYRLLRGPADGGEGFFAGIDTSLAALCDRAGEPSPAIADALNRAQKAAQRAYESFHPHRPRAVIAALAEGLAALGEAESAARRDGALIREIRRRRAAFAAVVADCSGIRVEASAAAPRATPGSTLPVIVRVWGAAGARVRLEAPAGFAVAEGPSTGAEEPETGGPRRFEVRIPVDAAFSVPYWLRESR